MQTRLQLIKQSALHSDVQRASHVAQRSDTLTVVNDGGGYGHFNNRECVPKMKDVHTRQLQTSAFHSEHNFL